MLSLNLRYQRESAELSHWLQSALDRLEFWTTQSVTVPQELETVRDHLYAFLVSYWLSHEQQNIYHKANNNIYIINNNFSTVIFVFDRSFPKRWMLSRLCVHPC